MSYPDRPTCKTCPYRYWDERLSDPDEGVCQRHPPTPMYNEEEGAVISVWPHVYGENFCGEHPDFLSYLEDMKNVRAAEAQLRAIEMHKLGSKDA